MIHAPKAALAFLALASALAPEMPVHAQLAGPRVRAEVAPVAAAQATLFPLEDVRLLPSPFKDVQETDRVYMLRLDPDKLLSGMRLAAGLTPKASTYGGWDSGGSGTVGHYLSGAAQMAQATGDPALRRRVDYIVFRPQPRLLRARALLRALWIMTQKKGGSNH